MAQGPAEEKTASCSHTVLAELGLTHRQGRDGAEGAVPRPQARKHGLL